MNATININIDPDPEAVPCAVCGCKGNGTCGHELPQWALDNGRGCALSQCGVCPCCEEKQKAITEGEPAK